MPSYRVSGLVTIGVRDCLIELTSPIEKETEIREALWGYVLENMKILDVSGLSEKDLGLRLAAVDLIPNDRGYIDFVDVAKVTNWSFD